MSAIPLIAARELQQNFLRSGRAYMVAAVFLLLSGAFFYAYLLETRFAVTSIAGFVQAARILVVPFAAIITMGLFAEERRSGTLELLLSAPVGEADIVLGKFLAGLTLYLGMLAATLYYPGLLYAFGDPDGGTIVASYAGLVLLGAVCLAVGLFAASVAGSQLTAAALCLGLLFALHYAGAAAAALPTAIGPILTELSLPTRFSSFSRGVIDSADIVYHVSLCGGFLYLAADNLAGERWR